MNYNQTGVRRQDRLLSESDAVSLLREGEYGFLSLVDEAGNPYGIFTLEDYAGAFEFALFGNNYVEFGKYMIKDLYLYITAIVQEKGADGSCHRIHSSRFASARIYFS